MLCTFSGAQLADMGSLADRSGPLFSTILFSHLSCRDGAPPTPPSLQPLFSGGSRMSPRQKLRRTFGLLLNGLTH